MNRRSGAVEMREPTLVHIDAVGAYPLIARHLRARDLASLAEGARLGLVELGVHQPWIVAFNYDFCKWGTCDPHSSAVQVGRINERMRTAFATWRSRHPVFSVLGWTEPSPRQPRFDRVHHSFGPDSVFADLLRRDGTVLWLGAPLSSSTIVHHVEYLVGGVPYRYPKFFEGVVGGEDDETGVVMEYPVSPLGAQIAYSWDAIERAAVEKGVIHRVGPGAIMAARARDLVDLWHGNLDRDPLSFLSDESRAWIVQFLEKNGRPPIVGDE